MKQSITIFSSLTTMASSSSNATINLINNNTIANEVSKPEIMQTSTSLFNNRFGYLNQDSWITNQSTIDKKYYSYDTSHAVGNLSDGIPTRNVFMVDNIGSLIIDAKFKISDLDKNMLNNVQQEMISHKQVTSFKDDYDIYSNSVYSDSYFSGDNSSWKYLQMGGVEKNIDISKQESANKVEFNDSLSETLGLYYIAQATQITDGIDLAVAHSLGKYFIDQSSLKNKFADDLTNSIINVITNNSDVYKLLCDAIHTGASNLNKNYATNYIFDDKDQLIEVYYTQFNKTNIENCLNYKWNDNYSWFSSDSSNQYILIKWSAYAKNWYLFTKIYSTFNFSNNSYLKLILENDKSSNINFSSSKVTNSIKNNQESLYNLYLSDSFGRYHYNANFNLNIWHDNDNIYFKWFLNYNGATKLDVNLNNVIFFNVMS